MLWQLAYTEIYFLDKLWPDFNSKDLKRVVNDYKKVKRNFGSIQHEKKYKNKILYLNHFITPIVPNVYK